MEKKEYALGSLLKIRQGVRKIIRLVADKDYNIVSTVQLATKSGKVVIEVQIDGKVDVEEVRTLFEGAGIQVDSLVPTVAKIFKTEISRFFFSYHSSILGECDIIKYIMCEEALWGTNIKSIRNMVKIIQDLWPSLFYWQSVLS